MDSNSRPVNQQASMLRIGVARLSVVVSDIDPPFRLKVNVATWLQPTTRNC